jgi:hypothetical protein
MVRSFVFVIAFRSKKVGSVGLQAVKISGQNVAMRCFHVRHWNVESGVHVKLAC